MIFLFDNNNRQNNMVKHAQINVDNHNQEVQLKTLIWVDSQETLIKFKL